MDEQCFDRLTRALTDAGSRRGLLGVLSTLSLIGGLFSQLALDESEARGRRRRRKKRHKHGNGRRKKHRRRRCKSHSRARTCAGKCGLVKNNCKKIVNCGPCPCEPACGPGEICRDGQCGFPCGDDFCPASNEICDENSCQPCDVCPTPGACDFSDVQSAIAAAGAGDTLRICAGTYPMNNVQVDKDLTIIGAGNVATILDGQNTNRVLWVRNATPITVTIRDLMVTQGSVVSGAGITVDEFHMLTLERVHVTDNTGSGSGGIDAGASTTLPLTDSRVTHNRSIFGLSPSAGGGIYFTGNTLTLEASHVEDNIGSVGGGIYVVPGSDQPLVFLTNGSTVTENEATNGPGHGGGIYNEGDLEISGDSSVSGNIPDNCVNAGAAPAVRRNNHGLLRCPPLRLAVWTVSEEAREDKKGVAATSEVRSGDRDPIPYLKPPACSTLTVSSRRPHATLAVIAMTTVRRSDYRNVFKDYPCIA